MSDTGYQYTFAKQLRIVNAGLTTSFVNLQALINSVLGTNEGQGKVLQVILISAADFKIADDVNNDATHFRTVKADTEKLLPVDSLQDIEVASVSGTPTLTIELYYA